MKITLTVFSSSSMSKVTQLTYNMCASLTLVVYTCMKFVVIGGLFCVCICIELYVGVC